VIEARGYSFSRCSLIEERSAGAGGRCSFVKGLSAALGTKEAGFKIGAGAEYSLEAHAIAQVQSAALFGRPRRRAGGGAQLAVLR